MNQSNKLFHILGDYKELNNEKKIDYLQLDKKNNDLLNSLRIEKNKIDIQKNWDIAKKFANIYEFIFSFNNDGVANVIPISRSYFKLIEILYDNSIFRDCKEIKATCLCEGPGGFIQAINDVYSEKSVYIHPINCITLISTDKKVPNWKLNNIKNYVISTGEDNTGNIYEMKNIENFVKTVGENSCNLVTADGGFDFSKDFNSQEKDFLLLLLCEIYTCLRIQSENGIFIVKVFDLFDKNTLNFVSLLRMFYEIITIQKPKTSRPANSEKYIICKDFTNKNKKILEIVKSRIEQKTFKIDDLISENLKYNTLLYVYEYNTSFVNSQIYYIDKTLQLIKDNHYNKKENIKYCLEWCLKYNIPIKPNLV